MRNDADLAASLSRRSNDEVLRTRIRLGLTLGIAMAAAAAAIAASGRVWLRVFIAPAWNAGSLVSGSAQSPSLPAVIGAALAIGFALGFATGGAFQPRRFREGSQGRLTVVNLLALYVVVALELLFYPAIAGRLIESVGGSGGVGQEYVLFLPLRLLPGALAFLGVTTFIVLWTMRRVPERALGAFVLLWLAQFFLFAASIAWYFGPRGPGAF